MSEPDHQGHQARSGQNTKNWSQSVRELHQLYCHWTDQTLTLRFDRERLWYEFLRAGFSAADLKRVVTYCSVARYSRRFSHGNYDGCFERNRGFGWF